jgi:hypothetical protein
MNRSKTQMEAFHSALLDCSLGDLGFNRSKFTWSNKRDMEVFVKERLDRALANTGWCRRFLKVEVQVLPVCTSDHKPLWIRLASTAEVGRRKSSFKFEACWNMDAECADVIREAWKGRGQGSAVNLSTSIDKLDQCRHALSEWSRKKFGDVPNRLKSMTKRLDLLQQNEHPGILEQINQLQKEIENLLEMEDIKWQQRAKRTWFKQGDRNTRYFHAWASHCRRTNLIAVIRDSTGDQWSSPEDIGRIFMQHFQNIFSSSGVQGVGGVLATVSVKVTPTMNEALVRPFQLEELKAALLQMQPLTSLVQMDSECVSFNNTGSHWGGGRSEKQPYSS